MGGGEERNERSEGRDEAGRARRAAMSVGIEAWIGRSEEVDMARRRVRRENGGWCEEGES